MNGVRGLFLWGFNGVLWGMVCEVDFGVFLGVGLQVGLQSGVTFWKKWGYRFRDWRYNELGRGKLPFLMNRGGETTPLRYRFYFTRKCANALFTGCLRIFVALVGVFCGGSTPKMGV